EWRGNTSVRTTARSAFSFRRDRRSTRRRRRRRCCTEARIPRPMRWNAVMGVTLLFGIFATHGAATAAAGSLPPGDRKELHSGIRLLVIRQPHLPMVVVSALIDAGSRFDPV